MDSVRRHSLLQSVPRNTYFKLSALSHPKLGAGREILSLERDSWVTGAELGLGRSIHHPVSTCLAQQTWVTLHQPRGSTAPLASQHEKCSSICTCCPGLKMPGAVGCTGPGGALSEDEAGFYDQRRRGWPWFPGELSMLGDGMA